MGYSLSWAALKGGDVQAVCEILGLRRTGQREEIAESEINGVQLPAGWCLVMFDHREMTDDMLAALSLKGEVVYCFVEDHVMVSNASGWRNGKEVWSVAHDCERGRFHLEIKGEAPPALKGIADRLIAAQESDGGEKADVDHVYDVPAELAKELTGFRHDQDTLGLSGEAFEILKREKDSTRGGWLSKMLGRLAGRKTIA